MLFFYSIVMDLEREKGKGGRGEIIGSFGGTTSVVGRGRGRGRRNYWFLWEDHIRGPLMWSSLLLPDNKKVTHGHFFWLSSTSSLPINLTIVNKTTKPRLQLSSAYPQPETQNQSQNQNFSQTHLPLSFSLPLALFPQYLSRQEIPPLFLYEIEIQRSVKP